MVQKFISPLMDAERCFGYQSELICSTNNSDLKIDKISYDLSFINVLNLPLAFWKVWKRLKFYNPNILISHNSKSSLIPLLCAYLTGVRVRIYFNHGVPYVGHNGITKKILFVLEWLNTVLSTDIITVSGDMTLFLKRVNSQINPVVIHNGSACGVDLKEFKADLIRGKVWRTRQGINHDDLVVVYIGRPVKRKGFNFLVKLWTDHIQDKNIKLVLCGPNANDVLNLQTYLPDNILPLGFVNNIPEVLFGSNILILPSLHEGLSYACIEAQSACVIVLANNIPGIKCLVDDNKTGFLIENNDPSKYLEIIQKINQNRNAYENIKQLAKSRAKLFSREEFIPKYLSFLKSTLCRP
jgi:N,N'-diacetylbacillosaminyl-diphospho-undecaprenol alpha-1,3-N-acetylgalactosaminyltransferase